MPRRRYRPKQIATLLRQVEAETTNGKTTSQACKEAEITVHANYRWRKEFGGLKLDQAKRMKELEREKAKLKRLVAELFREKQLLKDVASVNF
jgi:putative transposase